MGPGVAVLHYTTQTTVTLDHPSDGSSTLMWSLNATQGHPNKIGGGKATSHVLSHLKLGTEPAGLENLCVSARFLSLSMRGMGFGPHRVDLHFTPRRFPVV